MRYVVFGRETCPYCVQAVELLQKEQQEHKFVNFEQSQTHILQEIKEAYKWSTVPIILQVGDQHDIKLIGGYTDLVAHLES